MHKMKILSGVLAMTVSTLLTLALEFKSYPVLGACLCFMLWFYFNNLLKD